MSRPQGHRKSQSTSALSVLAGDRSTKHGRRFVVAGGGGGGGRKGRASQHPALGRVEEGNVGSASMMILPELDADGDRPRGSGASVEDMKRRSMGKMVNQDDVKGWMNDVMSLRSSERRRGSALKNLEKSLMGCCVSSESKRKHRHSMGSLMLPTFLDLQVHVCLVNLLTRHAQGLSQKHETDEAAAHVRELSGIAGILQGLCLLCPKAKSAVGEPWVLEILIDLLLLLRTVSPPPTSAPSTHTESKAEPRSIVYSLLDLLCCVLVDSPVNARTFERLSGLEAVVRVLKGTGVAKEIRMKCLEFLYFYLLPEGSTPNRAVSSSSDSSSSSAESMLYPPSPMSSASSLGSDGMISPTFAGGFADRQKKFADLDLPFIPQTPKKPAKPALGYLTPRISRRISGSISTTPSLPPIPASPRDPRDLRSPPIRGLASTEEEPIFPRHRERESGIQRDLRRWSVAGDKQGITASSPGLGLGLPKGSSTASGLPSAMQQRDITAIKLDSKGARSTSPNNSDPFVTTHTATVTESRSSSSGSSTVVPSRRESSSSSSAMSRSSTQPTLSALSSSPRNPTVTVRRPSVKRSHRSPLVQSTTPEGSEVTTTGTGTTTVDASRASNSPTETTAAAAGMPAPRQPKMRHSRTHSHLSALNPSTSHKPFVPERRHQVIDEIQETSDNTSVKPATQPQPTPARRGFPLDLTKGLPPSASTPHLAGLSHQSTPLATSKSVLSGHRLSTGGAGGGGGRVSDVRRPGEKEIRSVEEKKELLSSWLGNVDALVQGVERVSFLGSIGKAGRRA